MRKFKPLLCLLPFLLIYVIAYFVGRHAQRTDDCCAEKPVAIFAAAAPASEAPAAHHKLLYRIARDRAITQYARDKGITRSAAREKADSIDDATIHAAVQAAGLQFQNLPIGDKLEDFLNWIVNHQDLIIAIVKIIITLLALL